MISNRHTFPGREVKCAGHMCVLLRGNLRKLSERPRAVLQQPDVLITPAGI